MTNLEALKASVNYPVDTIKVQKILIDNGLNDSETYVGFTEAFDLSTAALYILLATSADIQEGDMKISATEKANYMQLAATIHAKYAEPVVVSKPKIYNRSNLW